MDDERTVRFETVYRETYSRITAYAVRRCGSPQDAADVVAETFTVAWRRIEEVPPGHEALLWLYGVARRVLANHHRGEERRQTRNAELDAELADLYGTSPDSGVELTAIAPDGGHTESPLEAGRVGDDWTVWEVEGVRAGTVRFLVTRERLGHNPLQ
ncbi:RNA polymerase sigma factor [Streptosporangium saharense]|uniref:RNA polymerase sigma factor n=1 Tax=Streptosporangium saharense TaxID=1706840 RepID=UPI0036C1C398